MLDIENYWGKVILGGRVVIFNEIWTESWRWSWRNPGGQGGQDVIQGLVGNIQGMTNRFISLAGTHLEAAAVKAK